MPEPAWIEPLVEPVAEVLSRFYMGNGGAALTRKDAARAVLATVADSLPAPAVECTCGPLTTLSPIADCPRHGLASGVVQDASAVRAAARADMAEEIAQAIEAQGEPVWRDDLSRSLYRHAARIARTAAEQEA